MIAKFNKKRIQNKNEDFKSTTFGVVIILLIFVAIGFFLLSNIKLKEKRENLDDKLKSLQQELQNLEKQNEELKSGINNAGTESSQKEKLYEQGYVDQGAQQVVVVPSADEQNQEGEPEQKTFWQKFFDNF